MITYYQCTFAKQATFFVDPVRIFNRAKFLLPCLLEESLQITGSGVRSPTLDKIRNKRSLNHKRAKGNEKGKTLRNKVTGVIY